MTYKALEDILESMDCEHDWSTYETVNDMVTRLTNEEDSTTVSVDRVTKVYCSRCLEIRSLEIPTLLKNAPKKYD